MERGTVVVVDGQEGMVEMNLENGRVVVNFEDFQDVVRVEDCTVVGFEVL